VSGGTVLTVPSRPRATLRRLTWIAALGLPGVASGGCSTVRIPSPETLLNEDQAVDLIRRPQRWYGRVVTVEIYPFDNGFGRSYRVCFERCGQTYAGSSPFVIHTRAGRFEGYRGDRPVVVTARYGPACVPVAAPGPAGRQRPLCPDDLVGMLTEVEGAPG